MNTGHIIKETRPASDHLSRAGLDSALQDAHQEIIDLRLRIAEYEWVESALQKRTRELSERVKELECLFLISHCLCRCKMSLPELLQHIVNELPKGFQRPDRTWAALELSGNLFRSAQFQKTAVSYAVDIAVHGRKAGDLRIFVLPASDAGSVPAILQMEKAMIETVGLWIESTVAHWHEADHRKIQATWWERLKIAMGRKHG